MGSLLSRFSHSHLFASEREYIYQARHLLNNRESLERARSRRGSFRPLGATVYPVPHHSFSVQRLIAALETEESEFPSSPPRSAPPASSGRYRVAQRMGGTSTARRTVGVSPGFKPGVQAQGLCQTRDLSCA